MWFEKRGLSGMVVTVLIILLALALIAIIWIFVSFFLDDSGDNVRTEQFTTNLDISPEITGGGPCFVEFDLQRLAGRGDIERLRFVLEAADGRTEVIDYPNPFTTPDFNLEELETERIRIECSLDNLVSVSVAPIFKDDFLGNILDSEEINAVCGNGIQEPGEACDELGLNCINNTYEDLNPHTSGLVSPGTSYFGTYDQACDASCMNIGNCVANSACNDGVDNDNDGNTDLGDSACLSESDGGESLEISLISPEPSSARIYPGVGDNYMIDLEFNLFHSVVNLQGQVSFTNPSSASCWYEWYSLSNSSLDSGGNITLPSCVGFSSGVNSVGLVLPNVSSQYLLNVYAHDLLPPVVDDLARESVIFEFVEAQLAITEPNSSSTTLYDDDATLLLEYDLTIPANNCNYTISDESGVVDSGEFTCGASPDITQPEGFYDLIMIANTTDPIIGEIQDSVSFAVFECPGDASGDNQVLATDISYCGGFGPLGCTEDSQAQICIDRFDDCNMNGDGIIDVQDLGLITKYLGTSCTP